MKKKRKIVVIVSILFIIVVSWLLVTYYKEYMDNVHIKVGKDIFHYIFKEDFHGNEWELYVNEDYICSVTPFEAYSQKEMRKHLANKELIKCLFEEGDIRMYNLPLKQYGNRYIRIYTVDGKKFYSYSDDYAQYDSDPDAKQRLDKLYEKYPKDEIKKRAEETWE